ncbi:hypothetical protein K435DRAFT_875897 [Dendrothele bispora CBS 962.96]|uniref:Uncharacterized protein n=1 Tax=Dendrothele bispora (strain CBS 962.96) TaxID=1314807 RepID=A0A4S8KTC2_DENBC|nr:hypothetical protein K435DRAFT_875897 [Dendrothele bispora CBS 962.96]
MRLPLPKGPKYHWQSWSVPAELYNVDPSPSGTRSSSGSLIFDSDATSLELATIDRLTPEQLKQRALLAEAKEACASADAAEEERRREKEERRRKRRERKELKRGHMHILSIIIVLNNDNPTHHKVLYPFLPPNPGPFDDKEKSSKTSSSSNNSLSKSSKSSEASSVSRTSHTSTSIQSPLLESLASEAFTKNDSSGHTRLCFCFHLHSPLGRRESGHKDKDDSFSSVTSRTQWFVPSPSFFVKFLADSKP